MTPSIMTISYVLYLDNLHPTRYYGSRLIGIGNEAKGSSSRQCRPTRRQYGGLTHPLHGQDHLGARPLTNGLHLSKVFFIIDRLKELMIREYLSDGFANLTNESDDRL